MKTITKYAGLFLFGLLSVAGASPVIVIETGKGDIEVTLNEEAAPKNVAAFLTYVQEQVYEGSAFHLLYENNNIMGGKPGPMAQGRSGSGNMSNSKAPPGEFTLKHTRGAFVMARTAGSCNPEMRSNSTQFAIYRVDSPNSHKEYSAIGYVTKGMDVVDQIAEQVRDGNGEKNPVAIKSIKSIKKVDSGKVADAKASPPAAGK